MRRRITLALAALALVITALVGVGSSPASASTCAIPGNWHLVTDPVNGHHACYRVFNQPVAGNPGRCWTTWYLQELVDYGTDQYAVSLRTNDAGGGWVQRASAAVSGATQVKSGYYDWAVPWTTSCTDFSNPTQVQLRFNHPGNSGWKFGTVDWVN